MTVVMAAQLIDCLLLGFYDLPFPEYAEMVRSLGEDSGVYRDLALAYVDYEGKPYRALDILSHFYNEEHGLSGHTFHNADFLWPVITYLATFLKKRGLSIDYVNLPHVQARELELKLKDNSVHTVAITTTLYVSPEPIIELVSMVRRWNPKARIIVGGPYINNQVRASSRPGLTGLFRMLGADVYVLCQEGEMTLAAVIDAIRRGRSLDFIPNLAFTADKNHYTFTLEQPESNKLAEEMVDYKQFSTNEVGEFITTRTAKSCPFACAFCGFPSRAGAYTYLGLEQVEKELDAIASQQQVTTLTILDDTFNVPKARFRDILRMMIRKNYGFRWNSFYRSDHGDEETIELMAEAGCEGVFLGVESGSDQMLQRMNKTARRRHYSDAIASFSAHNISTYASLIIGFPGETEESVEETISFIEETRPEYYRAQLWYADPVTPIWQEREKYGVVGQGFSWRHDSMDAERACDWIDQMFLQIENSTWLPQFGFEQWSTFYLQRKGMSRVGVRNFVTAFNSAIKQRMLSYGLPMRPEIAATLRASSVFPRDGAASLAPIERWSGATYKSALAALSAEMSGFPSPSSSVSGKTAGHLRRIDTRQLETRLLVDSRETDDMEAKVVLLAAYAAAVKKISGDAVVFCALDAAEDSLPVPMYFRSGTEEPFETWVEEAREKWKAFMPYSHMLMSVFQNPVGREQCGFKGAHGNRLLRLAAQPGQKESHWNRLLEKWGISEVVTIDPSGTHIALEAFTADADNAAQLRAQLSILGEHLGNYPFKMGIAS
jgi:radical SAM PhpK family P-methyltransferase